MGGFKTAHPRRRLEECSQPNRRVSLPSGLGYRSNLMREPCTLGWTMSCGSGRVLADMLSGRKPEIDLTALSIDRYARAA